MRLIALMRLETSCGVLRKRDVHASTDRRSGADARVPRRGGRCPSSSGLRSANRPSSEQRGYGHAHRARRRGIAPLADAGLLNCARCGERIKAGEPWDVGHVDGTNRAVVSGPEHCRCNRATARLRYLRRLKRSRQWLDAGPSPGRSSGMSLRGGRGTRRNAKARYLHLAGVVFKDEAEALEQRRPPPGGLLCGSVGTEQ